MSETIQYIVLKADTRLKTHYIHIYNKVLLKVNILKIVLATKLMTLSLFIIQENLSTSETKPKPGQHSSHLSNRGFLASASLGHRNTKCNSSSTSSISHNVHCQSLPEIFGRLYLPSSNNSGKVPPRRRYKVLYHCLQLFTITLIVMLCSPRGSIIPHKELKLSSKLLQERGCSETIFKSHPHDVHNIEIYTFLVLK